MTGDNSPVVRFHPGKIILALITLVVVMTILHLLGLYLNFSLGYITAMGFIPLFNFEVEANIPTFLSTLFLLASSFLLYWVSLTEKNNGGN